MESYRNTEPNPAVKGKNPGRVLKIALSGRKKKVKRLMTKPYSQPNPGCCCSTLARRAALEPNAEGSLASLRLTLLFLFPELIKGFPEISTKFDFVLVTDQVQGQREQEEETVKGQQELKEEKMGRSS